MRGASGEITAETLQHLSVPNEREWTGDEAKEVSARLPIWLSRSGVIHVCQQPCETKRAAIRIFVAAQSLVAFGPDVPWSVELQRTMDDHIRAGMMIIPKDVLTKEDLNWAIGALPIEVHVLLSPSKSAKLRTSRFFVRVYSRCGNCHKEFEPKAQRAICTGCRTIYYCDEKCQNTHWEWHRKVCPPPTGPETLPNDSK